jgi:hypothetical protein
MQFNGKSLYNLLRSSWLKDPTIEVEPWMVEDYRSLEIEELFSRLNRLGIVLEQGSFLLYAEKSDSPEELLDCLWIEEESLKEQEHLYLIIFELWRRLLPNRRSLTLFCDQLDFSIECYEENPIEMGETIQEILKELEDVLDQNVDLREGSPKEIFLSLQECCAHDIESFLREYISDQIDLNNELYASELLDGFADYVGDSRWFDFLRARLFALSDAHEGNLMIGGLLEELEEEPDLNLLIEMSSFLVHAGDPSLFIRAVKQALPLFKYEGEFQDLLKLTVDYFRCLDKEDKAETIQEILQRRSSQYHPDSAIDLSQKDISSLVLFLDECSSELKEL